MGNRLVKKTSWFLAAVLLSGCSALWHSIIPLDGTSLDDPASTSRLSIDSEHPALLRGLDEQLLPGVQVPNALRTLTYALRPGAHVLWASSVPYGHPLVPQYIRCYVINATFAPGLRYVLRDDPEHELAVLFRAGDAEPLAVGKLVDKPLVMERSCRWQ
jgi:hypothetical protein